MTKDVEMRLVLCTGPHRSGISLAAPTLRRLSAGLQPSHLGADPHGPTAHFETRETVELNDRILAELGGTWDTPTFDGPAALAGAVVDNGRKQAWVQEAADLIRRMEGNTLLAAIADPRICMLAPIWIEAVGRAGVAPGDLLILHVYRDPMEAALSLRTQAVRSPGSFEFGRILVEGAALWLAYTGQLYEAARDQAVTVVSHKELIGTSSAALIRLATVLGASIEPGSADAPVSDPGAGERSHAGPANIESESVLEALPALREVRDLLATAATPLVPKNARVRIRELWNDPGCREAVLQAAAPALGRLNRKAHQASHDMARVQAEMRALASKHGDETEALRAVIGRIEEGHRDALAGQACQIASRTEMDRQRIARLNEEAAMLRQALAELERDRAALLAHRDDLLSSTSWRTMTPVRALGDWIRPAAREASRTGAAPARGVLRGWSAGAFDSLDERLQLTRFPFRRMPVQSAPGVRSGFQSMAELKVGMASIRRLLGAGLLEPPEVPVPTLDGPGSRSPVTPEAPALRVTVPDRGTEFAATYLRRLRTLTASWPGETIGEDGLLHVLNATGSKPPLLWCFNGEHEFVRMAAGLGPDQPVVGMRSLNKVAPGGPERLLLGEQLADRYVELLLANRNLDRCAVGGNCQSAAIATHMALRLLKTGTQVELLVTLEGAPPVPYPGRAALIFGRESQTHNPFFREERPQDLWLAIHREVSWTIVPGAHGQYFTDANIGFLCAAIRDHLSIARAAPALPDRPRARLVLPRHVERLAAGSPLLLPVRIMDVRPRTPRRYNVLALWWSDTLGAWPGAAEGAKALVPVESDGPTHLALATPDQAGLWQLRLVLCQDGAGPVEDPGIGPQELSISLVDAEAAA